MGFFPKGKRTVQQNAVLSSLCQVLPELRVSTCRLPGRLFGSPVRSNLVTLG